MPQKSLLTWSGYVFDVVRSISTQDSATLAQHPLEDGAVVADHHSLLPSPVRAEILVTDYPADGSEYLEGRSEDTYLSLLQDLTQATVDDLDTGVRVHPDMVLTGVSRTRSRKEGVVRISLTWEPVRTASAVSEEVPLPHTSTVAAAEQDLGRGQTEVPSDQTTSKGASILATLFGGG